MMKLEKGQSHAIQFNPIDHNPFVLCFVDDISGIIKTRDILN